jgi:aspartate/methionine/tyrosine aminotransferase
VLISDEPYRALVFDDVVPPEVSPLVTRSIVATSWSKALAIPGERIGYLAFSPRMPEAAELVEACTFTSRVLGFVNAPALWQWVVAEVGDQVIDVAPYREKRDLMYEGLIRIGYRCVKPQGAFYVFPRTPLDDAWPSSACWPRRACSRCPAPASAPRATSASRSPWSATPWSERSPASSAPFAKRAGRDDVRGHGDRHR